MSEEEQEIRVLATLDVLRQDLRALHSMLDDAQRERDAARADADELRARLRTPRGRWILLGRAHEHARRARALRDAARAEVRQERDALLAAGAHPPGGAAVSGRVRRERVHEAAQERDRLLAHGAVTDEHHALADALGLREGKHSAASIARIALAEFERLRALSRVAPRALAALVARLEADADGLANRSFGEDTSGIPYAEHAEAARALLALVKGLEGE